MSFTTAEEAVLPSTHKSGTVRPDGPSKEEAKNETRGVNAYGSQQFFDHLFRFGVRFDLGKKRRQRPNISLEMPHYVVVEKGVRPGLKLWGKLDYLTGHCGLILIDERK